MATAKQCRAALDRLVESVEDVDPELRAKHIPQRTVLCLVRDLDVVFTARLDADGVHDLVQAPAGTQVESKDVRLSLDSDDLIALAMGREDFVTAWLRGKVHVSASVRDMLRLRSLFGL
ncbi:MAG TPA: SCP2 sterol-binding domain-containing protein [Mycobacteriales bacterium]|nr:SCP2 sterol-binding domain-containing protein [Mycobacteriales bacterium]HWB67567.1 SCP2 sterol-binding domain-containing protein [Mycobacteriales bacterium]